MKSISDPPSGGEHRVGAAIGTRYGARDFLTLVFKEKRLLARVFAACFVLALLVSFVPSVKYTANSKLLVLFSRDYVFQPEVGEAGKGMALEDSQIVKSEVEILSNRGLKEEVLTKLGLAAVYPSLAADGKGEAEQRAAVNSAVEAMGKNMKVEPVRESTVIHLSFTHRNPEIAAHAVNLLVDAYLDRRREVYGHRGSGFLSNQREDFRQRLTESEKALEQFKLRHNITSFEEQKVLMLRQQSELENQRLDTGNRLLEATARLQVMDTSMERIPRNAPLYSETTSTPAVESAKARLLELELRRKDLLTKYAQTSRFVRDVEDQIALVRNFISQETERRPGTQRVGTNPVYEQLSTEAIRLRAEAESLRARFASLEQQIATMNERRAKLEELEREFRELTLNRDILQQQYQAYAGKAEEARILRDLDQRQAANVRIIERAIPPTKGRNLQPLIAGVGLLGALLTALAAALLREFSRTTLATPEAVERSLGLPVLVSVPDKAPPPTRSGVRLRGGGLMESWRSRRAG